MTREEILGAMKMEKNFKRLGCLLEVYALEAFAGNEFRADDLPMKNLMDMLTNHVLYVYYTATAILDYDTGGECFTLNSFLIYMQDIELKGTCRMDYCYILCCSLKSCNDALASYLTGEGFSISQGWRLCKGREYLERIENLDQLGKLLKAYVQGLEGPATEETPPDLTRFHKVNEKGQITGVFDAEIVSYLIETVPMMILNRVPYIYDNGVFREDIGGIRLQAKIQALIFKEFIKSTTIRRVYDLLIIQPSIQCTYAQLNDHPPHWINFTTRWFPGLKPPRQSTRRPPPTFQPGVSAGGNWRGSSSRLRSCRRW